MNNTRHTPTERSVHKSRRVTNHYITKIILAIVIIASFALGWIIAASAAGTAQEAANNEREKTVDQSTKPAAEEPQEPAVFYALTPEQRTLIEQVVSAESRGEPYDGQVAVAQCILNACLKDGITPEKAIKKYKYTSARVEPTASVKEAVAAVFDRGEGITEEPIMYFYAPALVNSKWHESQIFVIEIANHRFFKEAE